MIVNKPNNKPIRIYDRQTTTGLIPSASHITYTTKSKSHNHGSRFQRLEGGQSLRLAYDTDGDAALNLDGPAPYTAFARVFAIVFGLAIPAKSIVLGLGLASIAMST